MKENYINVGDLDNVSYQQACDIFKKLNDSDKIQNVRLNEISYIKYTSNTQLREFYIKLEQNRIQNVSLTYQSLKNAFQQDYIKFYYYNLLGVKMNDWEAQNIYKFKEIGVQSDMIATTNTSNNVNNDTNNDNKDQEEQFKYLENNKQDLFVTDDLKRITEEIIKLSNWVISL